MRSKSRENNMKGHLKKNISMKTYPGTAATTTVGYPQ